MQKKNPLIFFTSFIVLILIGTFAGAKIYKSQNKSELIFGKIKSIDTSNHHGSLSMLTMGDAAIIDHKDYSVSFEYLDSNLSITSLNQKKIDNSWFDVNALYNIFQVIPSSLYQNIDNNFLYIKGQLEKDLTFTFSQDTATISFDIEEGYEALVNIIDIICTDETFNDDLYYIFEHYFKNSSTFHVKDMFFISTQNLNEDFDLYCRTSFQPYYQLITNTFSKDSTISLEFLIKEDRIESLMVKGNLKYKNFQASESIEWMINFD